MKSAQIGIGRKRPGLTLLEVVVVIGILGLLAALLVPAVQDARVASRRLTCQNHLRQFGVAMASFAESRGVFPTSDQPESAYIRLLPYLDGRAIAEALSASQVPESFYAPVFLCPEDAVAQANMVVGESSFYYNSGTQFRKFDPTNGFRKGRTKDTAPRDVSDGLSQTVAMSERLVRPLGPQPPGDVMESEPRRFFWWTEVRYGEEGEEPLAIGQCRSHRTTVIPQFYGTHAMNYHGGHSYDHMLPPNHPGCYNGPEDFGVDVELVLVPASSLHHGGVNALMGDGSVHFVSDKIDASVWQALGTRNGQETVEIPFGS